MSRGRDTTSYAFLYGQSQTHLKLMVEMSQEEAKQRLELFEKAFPEAFKFLRTERQSASQRPAKSPLVSSTLTPCSKDCQHLNRREEGDCPAGKWWWVCADCGARL